MEYKRLRLFLAALFFTGIGIVHWGSTAVVDQLTLIQATDTVGNSRLTINSNDVILANNIDSNAAAVSATNVFFLDATNTATGATNFFQEVDATKFTFGNSTMETGVVSIGTTAALAVDTVQFQITNGNYGIPIFVVDEDGDVFMGGDGTKQLFSSRNNTDTYMRWFNDAVFWVVGGVRMMDYEQKDAGQDICRHNTGGVDVDFLWVDSSLTTQMAFIATSGFLKIGDAAVDPATRLDVAGDVTLSESIYIKEAAAGGGNTAGQGQLWVSNGPPSVIFFKADDGTETQLGAGGGGGGGTIQDATSLTITATDTGTIARVGTLGTNSVDLQTDRVINDQYVQGDWSGILGGEDNEINSGQNPGVAATYTSHCNIDGGFDNDIVQGVINSTIGGGKNNSVSAAAADQATIGGGSGNGVSNLGATVGGGTSNTAGGSNATVSGGTGCSANGTTDVVAGGDNNDCIGGGASDRCAILGGEDNSVDGNWNGLGAGNNNDIVGTATAYCWIGGGNINKINGGSYNGIGSGQSCDITSGTYNWVAMRDNDVAASVDYSAGLGRGCNLDHDGVFMWSSGDTTTFSSTAANTFLIDASGGVGVQTNAPNNALTVHGSMDVSGNIIVSTTAGITAFATGGQGSATQLTTDMNEISTCATGGDSVKLMTAQAGLKIFIANNGAAACDVFPSSGDNLGAGLDTAVSLPAGNNITYIAYDATNWESF
jgi:hypothetical protein